MARVSREVRGRALRSKLAVEYGAIGFGFGFLWAWLAFALRNAVGSGWLAGLLSGLICFLVLGEAILRVFSYLADGTRGTLLSRSPDYSPMEEN